MSEAAVGKPLTYEIMEMKNDEFEMSENKSYEKFPAKTVKNVKETKNDSPRENMWSMSKLMKCMFVVMVVLAVILVGACVALVAVSLEISNLRRNKADVKFVANLTRIDSKFSKFEKFYFSNLTLQDERENIDFENIHEILQHFNVSIQTLQQVLVYSSCADILQRLPSSPSGYYWIRSRNGSDIRVYCDMTRSFRGITGGWMRVAELDMTDNTTQCPNNLELYMISSRRTCRMSTTMAGCSSTVYSANSVEYSKVCGRIRAYQFGSTDAFTDLGGVPNQAGINGPYVDGASLTHGSPQRHHIWTFTAALDEYNVDNTRSLKCPCISNGTSHPPAFVKGDYFCDSAPPGDTLWDGVGCLSTNMCCSFNNPPWFCKELPQPTTDDIEMRVCRNEMRRNEDIAVEVVELFLRE